MNACRPNLEAVLAATDADVVVPLGSHALKMLEPDAGGITKRRGYAKEVVYTGKRWTKAPSFHRLKVFPTWHPQATLYNPILYPQWMMDLGRIAKTVRGEPLHEDRPRDWLCITTEEQLDWLEAMLLNSYATSRTVSFDIETTGLSWFEDKLAGIGFAWRRQQAVYLPILIWNKKKEQFDKFWKTNRPYSIVKTFLESDVAKCAHNLMFDEGHCDVASGITVNGIKEDTMIQRQLLYEGLPLNLESIAGDEYPELAGYKGVLKAAIESKDGSVDSHAKAPLSILGPYGCGDADSTYRLNDDQIPRLREEGLWELYSELMMPLQDIARRMKRTGMPMDSKWLSILSAKLKTELHDLRAKIHGLAGREFNLASPPQVAEVLFEPKWMIDLVDDQGNTRAVPYDEDEHGKEAKRDRYAEEYGRAQPVTMGKKGPSTNKDVLLILSQQGDKIAHEMMTFRELKKLQDSYTNTYPELIGSDGFVHPDIRVAGTRTGRWAMSNPSANTTPRRKDMRGLYCAPDGFRLIAFDYSQLELRLQAHCANEPTMIQHYADGIDLHMNMATIIFKIAAKDVTDLQRQIGKGTNFSAGYGGGPNAVARAINKYFGPDDKRIEPDVCKAYIKAFFETYPQMKVWAQGVRRELERDGQVRSEVGRIRRLPGIYSDQFLDREEAVRQAVNFKVQSLGVDLAHYALIDIDRYLTENKLKTAPILEMHDAFYFLAPEEEINTVYWEIKRIMESPRIKTRVPLKVDGKVSKRWDNDDDNPAGGDPAFAEFAVEPFDLREAA